MRTSKGLDGKIPKATKEKPFVPEIIIKKPDSSDESTEANCGSDRKYLHTIPN